MSSGNTVVTKPGETNDARTRAWVTVLVLVVWQLPWPGYFFPGEGFGAQPAREAVFWVLTAALVAYVRLAERRSLSSIGLARPTWRTPAFGVIGAIVTIAGIAFVYMVVFPALGLPTNESGGDALKSTPLWLRVAIVLRAAVFEEIFYRGFAIERLTELTRRRWLAALISLAAFTFAHLSYWGWAHLLVAAIGGAVLSALYLLRRDLLANMMAHFLTDGVGFLLG